MYTNYIFDIYGTLIDIHTNESSSHLWKKMSAIYGFYGAHYTPQELKKGYVTKVKKAFDQPSCYTYPEIQIEDVFLELYTDKGISVSDDVVRMTGQFFRITSTKYIKLYDGVKEFLTELKEKGKKLYILSNAQRIFTAYELTLLGIDSFFDGIMLSSDEGCVKPDSAFYEKLLTKYNLDRTKSIMIGNDAICDIEGANGVSLDSLYLHTNLSPEIESELNSTYRMMEINIPAAKELILK